MIAQLHEQGVAINSLRKGEQVLRVNKATTEEGMTEMLKKGLQEVTLELAVVATAR